MCGGKRLQLILEQSNPFETTPLSVGLVASYFKQLKKSCIEVISYCLNVRHNTKKHVNFISALHNFLTFVNTEIKRPNILPDDFLRKLNDSTGQEIVKKLAESCAVNFPNNANSPAPVERFRRLYASLIPGDWTTKLQSMSKKTCQNLLLPHITDGTKTEGGRQIIVIKGVAIFVSQVKKRILELIKGSGAQEVHIIGLACIHVDCHLEQKDWHGMNVVVVTDKLFVDKDARWDLSGQDCNTQFQSDAPSGINPGEDGKPGELKII